METGHRAGRLRTAEEMRGCICADARRGGSESAIAGRKAFPRGHHADVSCGHACLAQRVHVHAMTKLACAPAKVLGRNCGNAGAYPGVGQSQVQIGEPSATHTESVHVHHVNVGDVHNTDAIETPAPPWVEDLERSQRTPSN